jgi:hypothetical protein
VRGPSGSHTAKITLLLPRAIVTPALLSCSSFSLELRAIQFEDSEALMKAAPLHQGDVDFRVAKRLEIHSRYPAVSDGFVHRRDGHDQRQASPSEFR